MRVFSCLPARTSWTLTVGCATRNNTSPAQHLDADVVQQILWMDESRPGHIGSLLLTYANARQLGGATAMAGNGGAGAAGRAAGGGPTDGGLIGERRAPLILREIEKLAAELQANPSAAIDVIMPIESGGGGSGGGEEEERGEGGGGEGGSGEGGGGEGDEAVARRALPVYTGPEAP